MVNTEQEFKEALSKICSKVPKELRPLKGLKDIVYNDIEVWTHCYHCNNSNDRWRDVYFIEKFREMNHKCHHEEWKCRHCGVGQLEVHSGGQEEIEHLPSYDMVLEKAEKFINDYLLDKHESKEHKIMETDPEIRRILDWYERYNYEGFADDEDHALAKRIHGESKKIEELILSAPYF